MPNGSTKSIPDSSYAAPLTQTRWLMCLLVDQVISETKKKVALYKAKSHKHKTWCDLTEL